MPSAQNFALMSREPISEADLAPHNTRCHAAVLYWMFRDFGDARNVALEKLRAISEATCPNHAANMHVSIPAQWFGRQLYIIYHKIANRSQLETHVNVGDVLVTNHPSLPNHSMVVVKHRYTKYHRNTNIRGFNNHGTFGAKAPLNAYDRNERHCDIGRMWHGNRFGHAAPGNDLYRIKFLDYMQCASAIRALLHHAGAGTYNYLGPT